jgi:hypothetical protein
MKTNNCTSCNREYVDYCSDERCPSYIKLVNKNYKEFIEIVEIAERTFTEELSYNIPKIYSKQRVKDVKGLEKYNLNTKIRYAREYLSKHFKRHALSQEIKVYLEKGEIKSLVSIKKDYRKYKTEEEKNIAKENRKGLRIEDQLLKR